jgi:hypothetical protein
VTTATAVTGSRLIDVLDVFNAEKRKCRCKEIRQPQVGRVDSGRSVVDLKAWRGANAVKA